MRWSLVPLSSLCMPDAPITYGILQPGPSVAEGVLYVRPTEIKDGNIDIDALRRTTPEIAERYHKSRLSTGDLLITIVGTIGNVAAVPPELDGANITQSSARIRPNSEVVCSGYLRHYLRSHAAIRQYDDNRLGATVPRLNLHHVRDLQIPLPPLPEQKRIAAILDAADALRAKRRESIEQLDALTQATFLEMFGDPVTNPKGLAMESLGEVATFHAGSTLPPAHAFAGQRDGFLYLKVSDLNSVENQSVVIAAQLWHPSKQKGIEAPAKSVVIPKRGGAIGTNKKRLLGRPAVLDPNLMAISCKTDLHHSYLLRWFYTFDLMDITSGSTVPQLNKRDLAPLAICIPPLDLQNRFASIVESIENQKAQLQAHLAELDALFSSLQSRAFNGELVA